MKIWVYSLCWNEKMFLPFYLWHYNTVADKIIIYDHHSDDGTRTLLKKYRMVEVRDYEAPGIHEPSVTKLYNTCYHEARDEGVDWVILCDIDEIIYDPDLWKTLQEYKDACVTVPRIKGYTMLHDAPPVFDYRQVYDDYRLGVEDFHFDKFAVLNPQVEIEYQPGRHTAKFKHEPIYSPPKIKLLHYRYWGAEWLLERHAIHAKRLSPENVENSWGLNKTMERNDGAYYTPKWFGEQVKSRKEVV